MGVLLHGRLVLYHWLTVFDHTSEQLKLTLALQMGNKQLLNYLKWEEFIAHADVSSLRGVVHERAELSLWALLSLLHKLLAHVCLVLVRMIQSLESSM